MRLTQLSDVAVRTLMYLAMQPDGKATVDALVDGCMSSRPQTVKAIQSLRKAGLIVSLRGRSGGIKIGKPANEITVAEVLRVTEESFCMAECFDKGTSTRCAFVGVCNFARQLEGALDQFLGHLQNTTIQDIVANADELETTSKERHRSLRASSQA